MSVGINIRENDLVNGEVKLKQTVSNTRSASLSPLENLLGAQVEMVSFGGTRAAGGGANMIEISNLEVKDEASLRENPLQIELAGTQADNEVLFPVTFDGEHYRVVGESIVEDSGQVVVNVRELPVSSPTKETEDPFDDGEDTRSLTNALKLAFFKIALKQDDLNKLCWNEFLEDGTVERHLEGVAEKVAEAENILILIHGIIGNTNDIATGLAVAKGADDSDLKDAYDLVLSYDYENLNTSIAATGLAFKKAMLEAGFSRDDEKTVTILAHSMGGLVSRWAIEQEQANELVDALILAGTPNNGSNFGKIESLRSFSVIVLDLALNFLPNLIPFAGSALKILKAPTQVLITLGEMNPGSEILEKLNASNDPGVPYFIVGGDATLYESEQEGFGKLMEKLELKVGDLINKGQKHDIAVELDSVFNLGVEGWANRSPRPRILTPVCHHLNYFHSPTGMEALVEIGLGAQKKGGEAVQDLPVEETDNESNSLIDRVEDLNVWDRFVKWLRDVFNV